MKCVGRRQSVRMSWRRQTLSFASHQEKVPPFLAVVETLGERKRPEMSGYEGEQFGNYRLMSLLGEGGFAEVYLGLHGYLKTLAAIKVLRTRLTGGDRHRFLAEARIIGQLDHPHIVRVLDFGVEREVPFLVMDYASRGSVRQNYLLGKRIELARIVSFVEQIASALQYAHDLGIIHRDVKPDNILLKKSYEVLLSDFGIAVAVQGASLLQAWDTMGTVDYAAPEQLRGAFHKASDQYALGVVVYEWLTGLRPFRGDSWSAIADQHLYATPPPFCEKVQDIAPSVEQVVMRSLAKKPEDRFESVAAFAKALAQAVAAQPAPEAGSHPPDPVGQDIENARRQQTAPHPPAQQGTIWNVPYHRNPFFTGREDVLATLYDVLHKEGEATIAQPVVISGLGGIGKTQTAIEYAYRFAAGYRAVLWARADTRETLLADFLGLARLLDLAEKDDQDAGRAAAAVKDWLEHTTGWLLILDNAEDLEPVWEFLPGQRRRHILMTTRTQVTGSFAHRIDLEEMFAEEGALLLLRRAGVVAREAGYATIPPAELGEAKEVAELLDGLPLALDQAGAYIEETQCGFSDYLDRYRTRRVDLLNWHEWVQTSHPEPVATTWSLSFERIEQANPAAADLLRFCAFLEPSAIPEEIFDQGAPDLGPRLGPVASDPVELDEAYRELRRFSLLRRDTRAKTLTIHRLVQLVLRDNMDEAVQRQWVERVVRAVSRTFPDSEDVALWPRAERCLPQAYTCMALLDERDMVSLDAARLFNRAGLFLLEYAQYSQAELLLQKAVAMRTILLGAEHPDVGESLNDLGALYAYQGLYALAEPLLRRALSIQERFQGQAHPDVAVATNNVALLCYYQKKYEEAEPLFKHALAIWGQLLDAEPSNVARTTNNLALLYYAQNSYEKAEPLYQQALAIWERILGPEHPDVARTLNNLAKLYRDRGKYEEAAPLFARARTIREKTLGPDHPDVAQTLNDQGKLYAVQGRFAEAEPLFQLALDIREQAVGAEHLSVAEVLENYASLLSSTGRGTESEQLMRRVKAIRSGVSP